MKKISLFSIIAALLLIGAAGCNKTLDPASIVVSVSELEVGSNGDRTTIGVKSNRDWEATVDCDWLTLSPSSAEAFEASSYMIVTVESNEDVERTAIITVASKLGDASAQVIVYQGENGLIIRDASDFVDYLNLAIKGEASNEYRIGKDIDLSGVTLPAVESFDYSLDGQGHIISNWTSSQSMFGTITANGSVTNLILDESCTLTFPEDATNFGFIANVNNGTIQNVENRADITMSSTSAGRKGAICGVNNAYIGNCRNSGDITFTGSNAATGSAYYAGVSGQVTSETARIENCTNTGNISFTFNEVLVQSFYIAGVVGCVNSNAKALSCTNEGDVTLKSTGNTSFAMAGGITTYSGGEIANSTNSGDISYFAESSEGAADGGVKGTGVAGIATYEGWANQTVSGNTNSGNITMRAGYGLGMQTSGSAKKYATNVGGVFGHMYKCKVDNCSNSGTVTAILADIGNSKMNLSTDYRHSAAGVVSSGWGEISNCENSGTVNATYTTAARTGISGNRVFQVGGITGGDYHSDQLSTPVTSCVNKGDINYTCDAAGPNNTVGGISGWPTKENNTSATLIKDCENSGNITVDGNSKTRIGGISGGAINHSGNINSGMVYLKGGHKDCAVGGISGLISGTNTISDCKNLGAVRTDVALTAARGGGSSALGGICGAANNQQNITVSSCVVKCDITAPEGSTVHTLIGVIGQDKSGSKNVFTLGTTGAPNIIAGGTMTLGGVTTQITSENYIEFSVPWGIGTSPNANVTGNVIFDATAI